MLSELWVHVFVRAKIAEFLSNVKQDAIGYCVHGAITNFAGSVYGLVLVIAWFMMREVLLDTHVAALFLVIELRLPALDALLFVMIQ